MSSYIVDSTFCCVFNEINMPHFATCVGFSYFSCVHTIGIKRFLSGHRLELTNYPHMYLYSVGAPMTSVGVPIKSHMVFQCKKHLTPPKLHFFLQNSVFFNFEDLGACTFKLPPVKILTLNKHVLGKNVPHFWTKTHILHL